MKIYVKLHTASTSNATLGNVNRITFELECGVYVLEVSDKDGKVASCQTGWTVPDPRSIVFDSDEESIEDCAGSDFINIISNCLQNGFNAFDFPLISPRSAGNLAMLFHRIERMTQMFSTILFRMKNDYRMFKKGNYYVGRYTDMDGMVILDMPQGNSMYVPEKEVEG